MGLRDSKEHRAQKLTYLAAPTASCQGMSNTIRISVRLRSIVTAMSVLRWVRRRRWRGRIASLENEGGVHVCWRKALSTHRILRRVSGSRFSQVSDINFFFSFSFFFRPFRMYVPASRQWLVEWECR